MLSNAVVAAGLTTGYVLILFIQLNPRLSFELSGLISFVAVIGAFYLTAFTFLFYVLLVSWYWMASEYFSPAWISVGVLARFVAIATATGAVLLLANLRTFAVVLQPETVRTIATSAAVLGVSSICAAAILVGRHRTFPQRRILWAGCLVAVTVVSFSAPLLLRGPTQLPLESRPIKLGQGVLAPGRTSRVTLVAIDAGSLDLVASATAEGRLPNFGRILDAGAVIDLATLHPTSAEAVWTAVATGKLPQKNGVRSASVYRLPRGTEAIRLLPDYCFARGLVRWGFLDEEFHTSGSLRVRTLWRILSDQRISVGVVNWPLTYPADPLEGYVVSDRYVPGETASTLSHQNSADIYPPDLAAPLRSAGVSTPGAHESVATAGLEERQTRSKRSDEALVDIFRILSRSDPTQVRVIRFQGTDQIGHYFLRYAMPSRFGDVTDEERRRFGSVLESHYAIIDDVLGQAIGELGPDDLLLVVSGYGIEPLGFGKRLLEQLIGDPDVSGSHEAAPDGFLLAYGAAVNRQRLLRRASVVDVAPTVLYFLGLPIGRDMDGFARTDLFRESFTDQQPLAFIPTYE